MNAKKPGPASVVIMAAGAVVFIASFLAFYKFSYGGVSAHLSDAARKAAKALGIDVGSIGGSKSYTAWGTGFFPLAVLPALLGLLMALQVALTTFADLKLPARVLGLDWKQIHLVFGAQALLLMLCYLLVDHGGATYGIGFWLMLGASIALVVGAVMLSREPATDIRPA